MQFSNIFGGASWRSSWRRLDGRRVVILALCLLVGVLSGLAAVVMHYVSAGVQELMKRLLGGCGASAQWVAPALPALGIFCCIVIVRLFFRKRGYETSLWPAIKEARLPGKGLRPYNMFSHIITSGVAVGTGISAGMEAPSALSGSAIGVNLARKLNLSRESRTLLLCAGGAAGIAAIFNAPLAGTLFACEVLLPGTSAVLLIPLLIAAAAGAIVSQLCGLSVNFPEIQYSWQMKNLWLYMTMGLVCGLHSFLVIRLQCSLNRWTKSLRNPWVRGLLGAVILYGAFLMLPALSGQGFPYIYDLLNNHPTELPTGMFAVEVSGHVWLLIALVAAVAVLKPVVSMVSLGSGGDGGMFAPSLVTGAFLGCVFYLVLVQCHITGFPAINCVAAGMAGMLAGVMNAPLTGLFLIAEMLGGYGLFVPLMLVVALATFASKMLAGNNLYFSAAAAARNPSMEVSAEAADLAGEQGSTPVGELADRNYFSLDPHDTFRSLLKIMMQSRQEVFPVIDDRGKLVGIVSERQIRPYILDSRLYDMLIVDDFMGLAPQGLPDTTTVGEATLVFDRTQASYLPVLHNGRFIGMLSRAHLLENYRQYLGRHDLF